MNFKLLFHCLNWNQWTVFVVIINYIALAHSKSTRYMWTTHSSTKCQCVLYLYRGVKNIQYPKCTQREPIPSGNWINYSIFKTQHNAVHTPVWMLYINTTHILYHIFYKYTFTAIIISAMAPQQSIVTYNATVAWFC